MLSAYLTRKNVHRTFSNLLVRPAGSPIKKVAIGNLFSFPGIRVCYRKNLSLRMSTGHPSNARSPSGITNRKPGFILTKGSDPWRVNSLATPGRCENPNSNWQAAHAYCAHKLPSIPIRGLRIFRIAHVPDAATETVPLPHDCFRKT